MESIRLATASFGKHTTPILGANVMPSGVSAPIIGSSLRVKSGKKPATIKSLARYLISLMRLCESIKRRDYHAVLGRIRLGIDLNIQIGETWNPLILAVRSRNLALIQLLLRAGADVNLPFERGVYGSALNAACFKIEGPGDYKVVELLLKSGADVNLVPAHIQFGSPLGLAAETDDSRLIQLLIDAGADVNLSTASRIFGSALALASFKGCFVAVALLLNAGADVNLVLDDGEFRNALMAALAAQNIKMVAYLLESGAHVNTEVHHKISVGALVTACRLGNVNGLVEDLLQAGAEVDLQFETSPHGHKFGSALVAACISPQIATAKLLLDAGANPNLQVKEGEYGSPLAAACCNKRNPAFVSLLLESGADPDLLLDYGTYGNAISAAITKKNRSAVEKLINAGAQLGPLSKVLLSQISQGATASGNSIPNLIQWSFTSEVPEVEENNSKRMSDYQWLRNAVAVIKQHDIMKLTTLYEWLSHIDSGLFVLDKFTRAYRSASQFYVDGKLSIQLSGDQVTIQTTEIDNDVRVFEPMQLICRIVRLPEPDSICLSQMTLLDGVYHLNKLKSLPEDLVDHNCWRGLFNSMIVIDDDPEGPCRGLELDFNILIQLSAVEYPVEIDSGLILMGYSTALIPVKETDNGMILWHLEIASHESQFKISDLKAIQGEWLKTQDLEYLQSRKVLLGWCTQARILLGTYDLRPTVTWSGAEKKSTTWHWKGANLQFIAQSASPLQIGGQAGMTFDRTSNLIRFSPSRNYIKCLTGGMMEQIVLYDVGTKRAWLVSLISVLHHMLLVYYRSLEKSSRSNKPPGVVPPLSGAAASLEALGEAGGVVIQGSNEDSLTIRELIMGFSVNLSRALVHKPKRSQIYGYEFMDIVMDSPRSELRKQTLEKEGLAWSSLLSEVNCLFCSSLGEVMIGARRSELLSSCNRLPDGHDFMAASMRSIEKLSKRYSHEQQTGAHRLSQDHFWRVSGDPFKSCKHSTLGESCWYQPSFLQEINGPESRPQSTEQDLMNCLQNDHLDGALVFGEPIKSSRRQMAIRVPELYQAQKGSFVPASAQEIHVERNAIFAHAGSRVQMDS